MSRKDRGTFPMPESDPFDETTDEQAVERVARAIWQSGGYTIIEWPEARDTPLGQRHLEMARAAIAALSQQPVGVEELREAVQELLTSHDNLYVSCFGPNSDPLIDIAAKPARALLERITSLKGKP